MALPHRRGAVRQSRAIVCQVGVSVENSGQQLQTKLVVGGFAALVLGALAAGALLDPIKGLDSLSGKMFLFVGDGGVVATTGIIFVVVRRRSYPGLRDQMKQGPSRPSVRPSRPKPKPMTLAAPSTTRLNLQAHTYERRHARDAVRAIVHVLCLVKAQAAELDEGSWCRGEVVRRAGAPRRW